MIPLLLLLAGAAYFLAKPMTSQIAFGGSATDDQRNQEFPPTNPDSYGRIMTWLSASSLAEVPLEKSVPLVASGDGRVWEVVNKAPPAGTNTIAAVQMMNATGLDVAVSANVLDDTSSPRYLVAYNPAKSATVVGQGRPFIRLTRSTKAGA